MALPRQVGLTITYDGTVVQNVSEKSSTSENYTVRSGDTLWAIAKKYLGAGNKYKEIYNANVDTIESTARAHGKRSSGNGHYIWPGEVLVIPGMSTETKTVVSGKSQPKLGSKIAQQASAVSYTDVASGQSDSISITMCDIEREWIKGNKPMRGSSLGASVSLTNWNGSTGTKKLNYGTFVLDDISFSGAPLSCVLNGVSVPAMNDFKSLQRTKTWEKTTIRNIASEIAKAAGVSLVYDADTIQIAEIEQSRQTDSAFLYGLCEKYGLAMKVYNHKIVIFDTVKYEAKKAVVTIKKGDMLSWSYNETVEGTYTGVELNYTDPDSDKSINVTIGSNGRLYSLNTQASGRYDAELQAAAKVNAANRGIITMDISIMANIDIVASHCVEISGLGSLDGKYYVDKVKHSIGSGYKMQLSMHKVQQPILLNASNKSGGNTYTVLSGDTLWGISKKFYGTGSKYSVIYKANEDVIEKTARAHGKRSSGNGHYIWPGEVLVIPEG